MRVVAIIQVRTGSTRLPGKALLPLAGKTMTDNIIERVKRATKVHEVVLAVPHEDREAFRLVDCGLYPHVGPANDLVERYERAADLWNADIVVRVPGDNPCVDPTYIDVAVEHYLNQPCIFYTNTTGIVGEFTIDGLGCEVLSMSRLRWLDRITKGNPAWREHPHLWFFEHGVSLPDATLRLDVNTKEDYDRLKALYQHFGHNQFTVNDIYDYHRK